MIIAIDGPAASGKGTLARRIARHYGYIHLDTGALYRAVAARVLWDGGDPNDTQTALDAAKRIDPDLEHTRRQWCLWRLIERHRFSFCVFGCSFDIRWSGCDR